MLPLTATLLAFGLAASAGAQAPGADPDTDGDGISDFREVHKHGTDPKKADSDGDGVLDGDPDERREFAYTVRSILQVLPPVNVAEITDDYQDARVLDRRADCIELEVVHYPLNTVGDAIPSDAQWREHVTDLARFIAPGPTTNWDARMQKALRAELAKDGIDAERLADKELVERASAWLMARAKTEDGFTTFMVDFEGGVPRPSQGQEERFAAKLREVGRTAQQQWDRELLGKGMFENKVHGTCTSAAIYMATALKALGVPARTIVCTPVIDATDEREWQMLARGITHHRVRRAIEDALAGARGGWTSHTFNEVWVGGRWRRLNYTRLGQNTLDAGCLGLMTHVHTFGDHAESGMARTWGLRSLKEPRDDAFGGGNPYSCISLSDRFGAHAKVDNLPVAGDAVELVISRVYWYDDPKKPAGVDSQNVDAKDGAGHVLFHVEDPAASADGERWARWYERAPKRFLLRGKGRQVVEANAAIGYWIDGDRDVREFYLRIEPDAFAAMKRGASYELEATGDDGPVHWHVRDGVALRR